MSAGRFTWTTTRWEHFDEPSGLTVGVFMDGLQWGWTLGVKGARGWLARGTAASPATAKGEARKALEEHLPKNGSPS